MPTRTPLIAGNWKMYKTVTEAVATATELVGRVADADDVEIMVAPSFTALAAVASALAGSRIALGGQNLHWESEGAFTGEVSAPMLVSAGCSHVIIGHSERRQYFGETDETVNRRIRAALDAGLVPVFCVGETEAQRESGETFSVLDKQVQMGLEGFSLNELTGLVIAYEPVWAIGTGKTANREQAQEVHRFIRELIEESFSIDLANAVRILYGGSVKPDNAADLMAMDDIDGALVGGASLKAETFSQIVNFKRSL
ncbi:MAG: triose-phosphate isomerase [Desulfobacterales bacterium]|nr:triose-phosphate isomerase [Desulfobacterales bacterium]